MICVIVAQLIYLLSVGEQAERASYGLLCQLEDLKSEDETKDCVIQPDKSCVLLVARTSPPYAHATNHAIQITFEVVDNMLSCEQALMFNVQPSLKANFGLADVGGW